MGATSFLLFANAASAQDGFNRLSDAATFEYGYDAYNGTISTTRFGRVATKIADKATVASEKKAIKYIEGKDYGEKWVCDAVDCGVVEYRVITVKKVAATGAEKVAAKYEQRYVVVGHDDRMGGFGRVSEFSYKTIAEAKAELEKIMIKRGSDAGSLYIEKRPVLISGSPTVAHYEPVVKAYKNRPKKVAANAKVEEIHRYAYYGWASC